MAVSENFVGIGKKERYFFLPTKFLCGFCYFPIGESFLDMYYMYICTGMTIPLFLDKIHTLDKTDGITSISKYCLNGKRGGLR